MWCVMLREFLSLSFFFFCVCVGTLIKPGHIFIHLFMYLFFALNVPISRNDANCTPFLLILIGFTPQSRCQLWGNWAIVSRSQWFPKSITAHGAVLNGIDKMSITLNTRSTGYKRNFLGALTFGKLGLNLHDQSIADTIPRN